MGSTLLITAANEHITCVKSRRKAAIRLLPPQGFLVLECKRGNWKVSNDYER